MRRILTLALTMTSLLTIACSGSAPTSPSRAAVAQPSAAATVAQSTPSALFGAGVVDFASCLQAAAAPGCITAPRVRTSAVTAGALAPTAPAGLTATAAGSTVTLTWLAPTGTDPVYVYIIEAGSKPGAADLASFSTGTNVTTFSASGVGAGSYYVRVRASDRIVSSAASNEVLLVVGGGGACTSPPGAPSGLATAASGSTVTLTWSAPAGGCAPTAYILQAGSAASLSNLANSNTGNTSTSYIAQGVGAGTYFVRILAANAFGQSAASNESTLVVGGTGPTTLTILPAVLPTLTVGVPVSITLSVVGGTGTGLEFGLGVGSVIPGVFINNPTRGMLSGTPTTAGPYLREFTVIDSAGNTGRITYSGTVNSAPPGQGVVGGTWNGLAPDGWISFDSRSCGRDVNDLTLLLTQTGSSVTGTMTWKIRESFFPPDVGKVNTQPIIGTVNGSSFTFSVAGRLTGAGTFTSTRMTGTITDTTNPTTCPAQTFAVNR